METSLQSFTRIQKSFAFEIGKNTDYLLPIYSPFYPHKIDLVLALEKKRIEQFFDFRVDYYYHNLIVSKF